MTPEAFVSKWSNSTTKERAAAQEHFIDLCHLLDELTPHEADPHGEWYAFEKGVEKTGAGRGWADVWKRSCFGWEYKSRSGGRASTMSRALKQLQLYALALESPPLLIVSDIDTIEIHTAFQNAVQEVYYIKLEELVNPNKLRILKHAFNEPELLRPKRTRDQITSVAAAQFAHLAFELRDSGYEPHKVAHFLNKILFCMFAEDSGVLKTGLFTEIAEKGVEHPEHFDVIIKRLFEAMHTGGPFGSDVIDWFNGGLFDDHVTLQLSLDQIRTIRDLARMDWSQIEPAIFGTLFERGLDPSKRSQLGAHYTDPNSIMRLVTPTIVEPLLTEWRSIKKDIAKHIEQMEKVKTKAATDKRRMAANNILNSYLEKLRNFRILDPACGSGNFLYLALLSLKDIEHQVNIEAEALGLQRQNPLVGPEVALGIEVNSYAAELARVTVWIGEIQWMLEHGYSLSKDPILKSLDNIVNQDAIMDIDGNEPEWPNADVIVGNPPFLGDRKMIRELGEDYVLKLRSLYNGRVPGGADLVTYWYEKARAQQEKGAVNRIGLVATNSIRGGLNRKILDRIVETTTIYNAWSDEPWVNEGAAVRVSLICFKGTSDQDQIILNNIGVTRINSDLTSSNDEFQLDLTKASKLKENANVSFIGTQKNGPFNIDGITAREWLALPNPHGKHNSDVIRPWLNASDITKRNRDIWIIDFGKMAVEDASLYEIPFEHVLQNVKPTRINVRRKWHRTHWWLFGDPRPGLRTKLLNKNRLIATPMVSKWRVFVWLPSRVIPENLCVAFARDDDETFGILHSRIHEIWSLRMGTSLEDRPRYTPTSTFETFPFPDGLTPNLSTSEFSNMYSDDISTAVRKLNQLRDSWLNPPEWVNRIPEVIEGYPDRLIPVPEHQNELKKRTLTNLYNAKPTWLMNAHQQLNEAVTAAYGWQADISEDKILENLLELNLSRS